MVGHTCPPGPLLMGAFFPGTVACDSRCLSISFGGNNHSVTPFIIPNSRNIGVRHSNFRAGSCGTPLVGPGHMLATRRLRGHLTNRDICDNHAPRRQTRRCHTRSVGRLASVYAHARRCVTTGLLVSNDCAVGNCTSSNGARGVSAVSFGFARGRALSNASA